MSCRSSSTLYLALFVLLATTGESFVVAPQSHLPLPIMSKSNSCLHLKTGQGSQLVAAWNAAHCHDDDGDSDHLAATATASTESTMKSKKSSSARAFVQKVFSLPSSMIRRHPHPQQEGLEHNEESEDDDVVYYPIVGFQFVKTDDHHSMAVPTSNCHAPSCNLYLHKPTNNVQEPVYGWFTAQACALGDLASDDYCSKPVVLTARRDERQQLAP